MTPDPLTAGELLAILAVLLVRLGKDHPLTRRVQDLHHAQPAAGRPETALGPTNSPNPIPSAPQPPTEPHNTEGATR